MNWGDLWSSFGGGNSDNSASAQSPEEQLDSFEKTLAGDPNNFDALVGAANQYAALGQPLKEAEYLERAVEVTPAVDLYRRLAAIYMDPDTPEYPSAVRVLNEATKLDPNDANSFLQLGAAERNVGNNSAAILAWNRYLQLDPNGDLAETVKSEIEELSTPATATTAGATTTTIAE
jgi:tetratricopeptide (TPR) repeat protein